MQKARAGHSQCHECAQNKANEASREHNHGASEIIPEDPQLFAGRLLRCWSRASSRLGIRGKTLELTPFLDHRSVCFA